MTKAQKAEQEEYREKLREMLKPGDTLHTVLRSVSRSGMYRTLDVYRIANGEPGKEAEMFRLTYWVAKAAGFKYDKRREAIGVGGCGTDVGFEVVYHLGAYLWPDGFGCVGERCPSNDHSNGDHDRTPHGTVYALPNSANVVEARLPVEHMHNSGGYALRQRWIG